SKRGSNQEPIRRKHRRDKGLQDKKNKEDRYRWNHQRRVRSARYANPPHARKEVGETAGPTYDARQQDSAHDGSEQHRREHQDSAEFRYGFSAEEPWRYYGESA